MNMQHLLTIWTYKQHSINLKRCPTKKPIIMKNSLLPLLLFCFAFCVTSYPAAAQGIYPKEMDGKWGFTDRLGNPVIDFQFEEANYFYNNLAAVKVGGVWGFIDTEGHASISPQFESVENFKHATACVKQEGKFGLIDLQGNYLLKPVYDSLETMGDAVIYLESGSFGIMDTLGKRLTDPVYQRIMSGWQKILNVKKDDHWARWKDGDETPEPLSNLVFLTVDDLPRFPGCKEKGKSKEELKECSDMEMLKFIYGHIRYPAVARENGVEGMVVVSFTITSVGKVADIEVVRDIGAGCGLESKSVVASMPDWLPGKIEGTAVGTRFNLPVKFKLE